MSEKSLIKDFDKLSKQILFCFIAICILLIAITYASFAQFYSAMKASNSTESDSFTAQVVLNTLQYEPTIQPLVQIKISGSPHKYYIFVEETNKTYSSSEITSEFTKSFLLPKTFFGSTIHVRYGIEKGKEKELSVLLVERPEPQIQFN
ncbi:hypothetical protein D6774_02280 [Candidatus Woesearchaeota archaeon]|jgi:hypothetical protein|nr:MAG: hypothetical protein D6774_02280 [Candidatus Woesearchaeota archaeon]